MNKFLPKLISKESPLIGFKSGIKSCMRNASGFLSKSASRTLMIIGLGLLSVSAFAQTRTITGKVTDSKDGSPVFGASVLATGGGSKQGTQTSAEGTYSLNVPAGATKLVVRVIGYASQEVAIGSGDTYNFSLVSTAQDINTVVVVGYGQVKKKDLTGAVTSLSPKEFNQGVIAAPAQLLTNKVAGLEVTTSSGQPGAATTIKIRGNNSVRAGTNPLYVVDGVPLDGGDAKPGIGNALGNAPASDPLTYINPNDIAQIDVLKDASATAIYGSRGSNGVIVITTKKGSAGPAKIEANANFGVFAGLMKNYEVLNASQFRSAITKYNLSSTLDGGTTVNPFKDIANGGVSQNYNLAFSGGSDLGKIRASFYGGRQQGYIQKSNLNKYVGNVAGEYKFLDKKLTVGFNLTAANTVEAVTPVYNNPGSVGDLISSLLQWNPTQAYKTSGLYTIPANGSGNPFAFNDATNDNININTFLGNISAAYKFTPDLEYKFVFGGNHSAGTRNQSIDGWISGINGVSGVGSAAIGHALLNTTTFTHTLDYKKNLTKSLNLEALVGYDYYSQNYSNDNISATGFNTNLDQTKRTNILYTAIFQNASTQNPLNTYVAPKTEISSYFGRVIFNLSDKYYLTGTFRADGSNKFGANNKYGYFPSGAAKWVVKNENFLKDSKFISNLALRGSWGITGSQEFPAGSSQEQYYLSSYNSISQSLVANPNLKWEQTKQTDLGFDFSILEGKVFGTFDYYHKNTSQILFETNAIQPAPASQYFVNLNANNINSGFEFSLGTDIISKPDLTWTISGNVAYNHNILKNFTDPNTGLALQILTGAINGQGVSGTLGQIITNNKPIDEYYLKAFGGFDSKGNQIIGANPNYAGDPAPKTIAGISTSLRYKKLTFSANVGGAFNFKIYNNTETSVTNISGIVGGRNIDLLAYNSAESVTSAVGASDRFLENGNYVKLRNATLAYSFGNAGKYVKDLRFYASGSNLFVITKFSGFDPEVNIDAGANNVPSRSIEYVPFPTPRTITFGLGFSL